MIVVKSHIKVALLLAFAILLLSQRNEISGKVYFPLVGRESLHNVRINAHGSKPVYAIDDLSYQHTSSGSIVDVALSFNYPGKTLIRDDTGKYNISYASYEMKKHFGALGKGCAFFYKKDHYVKIKSVRNLWLGSCGDLGSFTIEFRFYPVSLRDGSILFSRLGYFSGGEKGISINIRGRRVISSLYGLFYDKNNPLLRSYDVHLRRSKLLQNKRWYHYMLSYDRLSGKLVSYIDGREQEVFFLSQQGNPFQNVYSPTFGQMDKDGVVSCIETPQAVLGRNFSGYMDEFRISYIYISDLKKKTAVAYTNYLKTGKVGRTPFNYEGIITSPVYAFSGTGTKVTDFSWDSILRKHTFIWMQFRISDHSFLKDNSTIKWYRIKNGQSNIFLKRQENGLLLSGKYYQWKAHLVASPEGKYSPSLSGIRLTYQLDVAPDIPRFVEVVKTGDDYIILKWKKNVDYDIMGYKIYYGTAPRRYDGVITYINSKTITNGLSASNYVSVKITNELIEENKKRDKRNLLSYPHIKNTVLYFFAVSSYDSYRPDTQYNHESDVSQEVSARPFAGSEID